MITQLFDGIEKAIIIAFFILLWLCTLFAADINVHFVDGSRLVLKGWASKLINWWRTKYAD